MKTLLDLLKVAFEKHSKEELQALWDAGNHWDDNHITVDDFLTNIRYEISPHENNYEIDKINTNLGSKIFEPFFLS